MCTKDVYIAVRLVFMSYVVLWKRNAALFYIYIKRHRYISHYIHKRPMYIYIKRPIYICIKRPRYISQYIHKETYIYIYQHVGRLHIIDMCIKDVYIAICRGGRILHCAVKEEWVTLLYIHKETYIYIRINIYIKRTIYIFLWRGAVKEECVTLLYTHKETHMYIYVSIYT